MKRRLLLMALISLPAVALAARISTRGAGKAGGPLDPRRKDGELGEAEDQVKPVKSEDNEESEEGKIEVSSQQQATD